MMSKLKNRSDILFEIFLIAGSFTIGIILITILIILSSIPINNYHYENGLVEYTQQFKLSSQREGIIEKILVANDSYVSKGTPVLKYFLEQDNLEAAIIETRLKYLEKELEILNRLQQNGAITQIQLDKTKLEILELNQKRNFLKKNVLLAPVDGFIHFTTRPEYLKGSFIKKSEIIAYVHDSKSKHIKISSNNQYVDRFKIGSVVLIKYKDPISFVHRKMKGHIYKSNINERNSTLELYCEITHGRKFLNMLPQNSTVQTSIIVNSSSIINDLFGFDILTFHFEKNHIGRLFNKIFANYDRLN